jgi:hypothetical protein
MNQLLKNVLKLIKKNIGNENAPWMTRIAGTVPRILMKIMMYPYLDFHLFLFSFNFPFS